MLKWIICLFIAVFLTVISQLGGIVLLFSILINGTLLKGAKRLKWITFPALYFLFTFVVTPPIAQLTGRVALPVFTNTSLQPRSMLTCLLNRHYVKPELKKVLENVSYESGLVFYYLDANFPFFNGFPLLPHLSHNDGEKVDLAFSYRDEVGNTGHPFSFLGYGYCEQPKAGEENTPELCRQKGFWQYSLLEKIVNQHQLWSVDAAKTKWLIQKLSQHPSVGKLFVEPHLKQRWGFANHPNVRFHGCGAVRHDDHIHVQL